MRRIKLPQDERIAWLRLARSENVGSVTFENLMRFYEKPSDAIKALPDLAKKGGAKRPIKICSQQQAAEEFSAIERLGGEILFSCDEDYPNSLSQIKNLPPVLTVLGRKDLLNTKGVAFVGARNASLNGKNLTRKMAFDCVQNNLSVISGLALGIDGAAHEGALSANNLKAGTVAVLGCGVDVVYPMENQDIYAQIKEQGALVSEFPLHMRPTAINFPRRNRLISGLSVGVVVVEAKDKSGSLITAQFAKEQGRKIMAVPGSPADDRSVVPNMLIKEGASLIQNAQDILDVVSKIRKDEDDFVLCEKTKKLTVFRLPDSDEIADARQVIFSALSSTPISEDELSQQLDLPSSLVSVVLLELELAGRLERHALGRVSLVSEGISSSDFDWMEEL